MFILALFITILIMALNMDSSLYETPEKAFNVWTIKYTLVLSSIYIIVKWMHMHTLI